MRVYLLLLLCFQSILGVPVAAEDFCDPLITIGPADSSLKVLLTRLAKQHDFQLLFPDSLDRPLKVKKAMSLNRMIKKLTIDMNTVLKHKVIQNCEAPRLSFLLALPESKESYDSISLIQGQSGQEDYIYIENMGLYVSQVLDGSQVAEIDRMTPEQLTEYEQLFESLQVQREQVKLDTDAAGN
ncbi:MAG: hypothetical protein ACI8XC_000539 [Gammaproteobacteria bacterium]|jgi:hypothetical protein